MVFYHTRQFEIFSERCQSECGYFCNSDFSVFNTMAGHNVNVSIVRYTQDTAIAIVQIRHNEK